MKKEVQRFRAILYPDKFVGKIVLSQRTDTQLRIGRVVLHQQDVDAFRD